MNRLAASVLLAVELGGGFGTATATVVSTTEQSTIVEIHVEVAASADAVVAHLTLSGEETVTVPMLPRGDGVFGVTTEIRSADYVVVFEAVGDPGAQSQPVRLSELGLDFDSGQVATSTTVEDEQASSGTQRWLWLGVALGAASLSALAFWVLGGRNDPDGDNDRDQLPSEEPNSGA